MYSIPFLFKLWTNMLLFIDSEWKGKTGCYKAMNMSAGWTQGSVLGPLTFTIFINTLGYKCSRSLILSICRWRCLLLLWPLSSVKLVLTETSFYFFLEYKYSFEGRQTKLMLLYYSKMDPNVILHFGHCKPNIFKCQNIYEFYVIDSQLSFSLQKNIQLRI